MDLNLFRTAKRALSLLPTKYRSKYRLLILLMLFGSALETLSIISIVPFISIALNPELVLEQNILLYLYESFGIENNNDFMMILGSILLLVILLSALVNSYLTFQIGFFSNLFLANLSASLLKYYANKDWIFHLNENSNNLRNKILMESERVANQILLPVLSIIAKSLVIIFLILSLAILEPLITGLTILIFVTIYLIIYSFSGSRIQKHGEQISNLNEKRIRNTTEIFEGLKELKVLQIVSKITKVFNENSSNRAKSLAKIFIYQQLPKYAVEFGAFFTIISLVIFLYASGPSQIISSLSLLALASIKILPNMQNIYALIASVRSGSAALENVYNDVLSSNEILEIESKELKEENLKEGIIFDKVGFRYSSKQKNIIENLSFGISLNESVGIVGRSGSGKSTLLDMIMQLLAPTDGQILVDNKKILPSNIGSWLNNISYLPQSIFIKDGTLLDNITLGKTTTPINKALLDKALIAADLSGYINNLPDGLDTHIGENGAGLSGGQRQRVGIARALYRNSSILILDEATSALDRVSEKKIISNVLLWSKKKTLIMVTHRVQNLEHFDKIFLLNNGKIEASGSFLEIYKNELFRSFSN